MAKGLVYIYAGDGRGKSPAALGRALQAAMEGKNVVIIQFLKGSASRNSDFLRRMEPEIKLFRFQRREAAFEDLSPEDREEEVMNMKSGLGFAKKVLATGECDVLVLDEILGLVEYQIVGIEDIRALLEEAPEDTEIIFTGIKLCSEIMEWADGVYQISTLKESI